MIICLLIDLSASTMICPCVIICILLVGRIIFSGV